MDTNEMNRKPPLITDSVQDALIMLDPAGVLLFWNPAAERIFGWIAAEVLGQPFEDFLLPERFRAEYRVAYQRLQRGEHGKALGQTIELIALDRCGDELPVELSLSLLVLNGNIHAIGLLRQITERKRSVNAPQHEKDGPGDIDMRERCRAEQELNNCAELKLLNQRLEEAQSQLIQSEKMASIGQLAAGVAHEINNPVGFVNSNLGTLKNYCSQMMQLIALYQSTEAKISDVSVLAEIAGLKKVLDLDFLREDLPALIKESEDGLMRVKSIINGLKDFSHVTELEWCFADLNAGLDSTLNVVWNEVKYKAKVEKIYGQIPPVECLAAQLNQVFMNLIINAVHALDESMGMGLITLSTGQEGEWVWVEVRDSGRGMTADVQRRVFEPFFTTKPVGKGTGLGLSLSFDLVQKHGGRIELQSKPGEGSRFTIWVPVRQPGKTED